MNLVVGRVSTNPRGFAFVDPESPGDDVPASIYIAGNNLNQAMHGDRVVVRVEHQRDPRRAEGRILRILERASERIVAVVNESGKDITDLSFLEQRGVVVRTRGPEDTSLVGMLADLAGGQPTRGPTSAAKQDTKQPRGAVVMVPLEVIEPNGEQPAAERIGGFHPAGPPPPGACSRSR